MGLMGFITLFCLSFIANYNSVKKGMQLILAKIFSCGKESEIMLKRNSISIFEIGSSASVTLNV